MAELFGGETGDRVDKCARVGWRPGEAGSPVLQQMPIWFTGRIEGRIEGGDYVGFPLTPVTVCPRVEGPLPPTAPYRELRALEPGHLA
ncbi:hypothetical protein [Streptomyces sp. NPDC059979]|uniref:hypothetical protein n=1 Tax=Streptomyces sp. NPDC059979 TaxID=3347021 RepID=UPI0036AA554A